jgi:hypothetical protein
MLAAGQSADVGPTAFSWSPGAWLNYAGVNLTLPPDATVRWPLLPHNPYRKNGAAQPEEVRIVIDLSAAGTRTVAITVPPAGR